MSIMPRTGVGGIELTGTDELLVSGDVKLPLMVYRPETILRVPAVVVCSGGIGTGMFEAMEWIGRSLQRAGVLAVTISWRGSSPEFDVDDASLAADWLASQNNVDPNRIAIFGMSRGGNAALRTGALDPRFKSVVTFGALTNFLQMIERLALYAPGRRKLPVNWLGDPETHRDFYERVQTISWTLLSARSSCTTGSTTRTPRRSSQSACARRSSTRAIPMFSSTRCR